MDIEEAGPSSVKFEPSEIADLLESAELNMDLDDFMNKSAAELYDATCRPGPVFLRRLNFVDIEGEEGPSSVKSEPDGIACLLESSELNVEIDEFMYKSDAELNGTACHSVSSSPHSYSIVNIDEPGPSSVKSEPDINTSPPESSGLNMNIEVFMYKSDDEDTSELDDDQSSSTSSWNEDSEVDVTKVKKVPRKNIERAKICTAANPLDLVVNWVESPCGLKTVPFTERTGLHVAMPDDAKPIDYFFLLADDSFFDLLCTETNAHALELFLEKPEGRIVNWRNVTVEDMKTFLGLVLHMGPIQNSRIEDYWKTHRLFGIPCFQRYMRRNRFLLILKCFHFEHTAEGKEPVPDDHLYKVRPVLNFFNDKMESIYTPHKQLYLDEPMVLHRGKLIFQRCIKNENHNYGFKKLYTLSDSDGVTTNFALCNGTITNLGGPVHSSNMILTLMKNKLNKGYSLYVDKFYCSFLLAKQLLEVNTYCTGVLHPARSFIPEDVSNATLNPGESICRYAEGVCVGKWNDKRDYLYLSTEHSSELVKDTNYKREFKHKPKPMVEFNRNVPNAEVHEQMMSYYPFSRKTLGWFKKLGFHVIHMMVFNAYLLYNKKATKKMCYYEFRLSIVEALLPGDSTATIKSRKKRPNETLLEHFPIKCPKNSQGRAMRRRCKLCWGQNIRKDTPYLCGSCEGTPGLCLEPCFKDYHVDIDIM